MPVAEPDVTVWYNPRCSKCRGAEELLAAHGVPAQKVFYLDSPPGRDEITRVLALLGSDDPRTLMRTAEPRYRERGLAAASADELVEAMTRYPELIQRPVVIWADRAVIARPPELLLPLLEAGRDLYDCRSRPLGSRHDHWIARHRVLAGGGEGPRLLHGRPRHAVGRCGRRLAHLRHAPGRARGASRRRPDAL